MSAPDTVPPGRTGQPSRDGARPDGSEVGCRVPAIVRDVGALPRRRIGAMPEGDGA